MKQKTLLSLLIALLFSTGSAMALSHGSAIGKAAPLYPIYDTGAPGTPVAGKTIDFKVVSIAGKTWAWANFNGGIIAGNAWSSQLRYRQPNYLQADENQLLTRITGTQQTYGIASRPMTMNPLKISFLQEENNAFFESATYDYDNTRANNADASDNEKPVLGNCTFENLTSSKVDLHLAATDNSGDYFYYIEDTANGISDVTFLNKYTISGLKAEKQYHISVTAIDFSGNESTPSVINFSTGTVTSITSGIAQGLSFELSTTPEGYLKVYGKLTNGAPITDAYFRVVPYGSDLSTAADIKPVKENWAGVTEFTYIVKTASLVKAGTVLEFSFGYLQGPVAAGNWDAFGYYNNDLQYVTDGANVGAKIVYVMEAGTIPPPPPPPSISSGIADGLYFELSTTLQGHLRVYGKLANNSPITDAYIKAVPLDGDFATATEHKPVNQAWTGVADYTFVISDAAIIGNGNLVELSLGYLQGPVNQPVAEADWGTAFSGYKMDLQNITEGANMGAKIVYEMGSTNSVKQMFAQSISLVQNGNTIIINSENAIASSQLHTVGGQLVTSGTTEIAISTLAKGIYILSVKDVAGNIATFKIALK